MSSLTVLTFLWGVKYTVQYVERLGAGLRRHLDIPFRFICVADRPRQFGRTVPYQEVLRDLWLTKIKGCFCRLCVFDPVWQKSVGIAPGDRILVLDLDLIVTGPLAPLVDRPEPFVILQGVNNPSHPTKYNGSVWLTTAGYRPDVWSTFSMEEANKLPRLVFPDDQGWFQAKMPDAAAFTDADGVYAFGKSATWPKSNELPTNARIVAFPGSRDPKLLTHLPFVRQHWLGMV